MMIPAARRADFTKRTSEYAKHIGSLEPYLLTRGISLQVAEMFGLGYVHQGQFEGRLAIPYHTPSGVVQTKYRCAEIHNCKAADCRRYLYEAGTGLYLYNAQVLIQASERVVVTEGELDAICVQAYCGIPAVAYPGVETWQKQKHWRLCFEGVGEVIVVADGDDVGRKAAHSVAKSIGLHARVADLPDGYDANQFIAERGAAAFEERVTA